MKKHKWTEEEINIVRRDYDGTNSSAHRIAFRLGVTFNSVKGKVQACGIAQNRSPRWSDYEINYLMENFYRYRPQTVANKLHRSLNSVILKSKRLGLSRKSKDGWYNKQEVCEILGVDHKKVQQWIDLGGLKAEWNSHKQPGKGGMAYWRIKEEDLRNFIINYSCELQGRNVDLFQVVNIIRV